MSHDYAWDFAALDAEHRPDVPDGNALDNFDFDDWNTSELDQDPFEREAEHDGGTQVNDPAPQADASSPAVGFSSPPQHVPDERPLPSFDLPPSRILDQPVTTRPPTNSRPGYPQAGQQAAEPRHSRYQTRPQPQQPPAPRLNPVHTRPPAETQQQPTFPNNPLDYNFDASSAESSDTDVAMPPARRSRNSLVDLTETPAGTTARRTQQTRKRSLEEDGAGASGQSKRKKRGLVSPSKIGDEEEQEDEAPSADAELLKQQQMDALKEQEQHRDAPQKIGKRQCIICLESYTNATTAICGHLFCHECLTRALIASEKSSDRSTGNCPACRKPISRKKDKQIIPISFMKKDAFETKGRPAGYTG